MLAWLLLVLQGAVATYFVAGQMALYAGVTGMGAAVADGLAGVVLATATTSATATTATVGTTGAILSTVSTLGIGYTGLAIAACVSSAAGLAATSGAGVYAYKGYNSYCAKKEYTKLAKEHNKKVLEFKKSRITWKIAQQIEKYC